MTPEVDRAVERMAHHPLDLDDEDFGTLAIVTPALADHARGVQLQARIAAEQVLITKAAPAAGPRLTPDQRAEQFLNMIEPFIRPLQTQVADLTARNSKLETQVGQLIATNRALDILFAAQSGKSLAQLLTEGDGS